MSRIRQHPSQSLLREYFDYCPDSGVFVWRKAASAARNYVGKIAGSVAPGGYVLIGFRGQQFSSHRLAWIYVYGVDPYPMEIDHRDGNRANNAIANLRLATSRQQKQNKVVQRNNRSGLKGAYFHAAHSGKKWRSQIKSNGKLTFLGYFATPQEAHEAHRRASVNLEGEFSFYARAQ